MSKVLENLKYAKSHEWVKVVGEYAYIGISDYAQNSLGSIVYLEVAEVYDELNQGKNMGVVESVKAASDLFAPLSGTVVEVNEDIVENPEKINEDSYESWMIKIKIKDQSELTKLLDAKGYQAELE
jgi:glycine cleavage system H protein